MSTNLVTKKIKNSKPLTNLMNALYLRGPSMEEQALEEFFLSLDKAHQEIQDAENFFNNVIDHELVDHAIYKMEAARSKYSYLLKQAKEKGIRVNI
jgi:hypothetical protein